MFIPFRLRQLMLAVPALLIAWPSHAAFVDNGDGTVTDTVTSLMWDKCSWGQSGIACASGSATPLYWKGALAASVSAGGLNYKGHSDWRLPNVNELESLVKLEAGSPAVDSSVFPNTLSNAYWSSTPYVQEAGSIWYVNFSGGEVFAYGANHSNYVRLVRGGQLFAAFDAFPGPAPDATPDPFSFAAQSGTALSSAITSNAITVSGVNTASPISITGGKYSIDGGAYTSADGTVTNGQTVTVRLTSAGSPLTLATATLSIGGVTGAFNVTTAAAQGQALPQSGVWWNPAESGRGYMVEMRGGKLFMGMYHYADNGRATWLASTGPMASGTGYQGNLVAYANGQTLTGSYARPTGPSAAGQLAIAFSSSTQGTLTLPTGTVIPIERFNIVPGGVNAPPAAFQPESGVWWNPAESGRGFSLEIQGGTLFMGGYMYDAQGNPIWYSTSGPMATPSSYQGNWVQWGNGQTLGGGYRAPVIVNSNAGNAALNFSSTTDGTLTLPDGKVISLTRFRF